MLPIKTHIKDTPIVNFEPKHELFIYKAIEKPEQMHSIFREMFNVDDKVQRDSVSKRINKILIHPKAKEIIQTALEKEKEIIIKRSALSKEDLINMYKRIHDKCMTDVPVTGMFGDQVKEANPFHDPKDEQTGEKVIGVYQFKPLPAIKSLENIQKLLGYDVQKVEHNHKHSIIDKITEALPQTVQQKSPEQIEIKEAEYSLQELDQELNDLQLNKSDKLRDSKPSE